MKYQTTTINALVLAGGVNDISLFDGYVPGYKGLLRVRGRPLIQYALDALKTAEEVQRICIVGPVNEMQQAITTPEEFEFVPCGQALIENIQRGLEHFRDFPLVLVMPSDLPLVTPQAIKRFLEKCRHHAPNYEAAVFWSMVPERSFAGPYVQVKKGFNRFRDISVCHGNLLAITPRILENRKFVSRMEDIYKARKSSVRAALAVGPLVGLSYLAGVHWVRMLTLSRFAKIASFGFGVGLVPIIMNDPQIAVDIDEARDYRFITEQLERRENEAAGSAQR
jgi:GTP:adenosylcobinamide-phosphate guanylyltransferase